jgi:hypothetical protein
MSDQLTKLFNDKLAIKPIAEVKTVEKKIKKKDVIVPDFKDSMLPFIEYDTMENIRVYNGVQIDKRDRIIKNTEFYKMITPHNLFSPPQPSTITSRGDFSNVEFLESDFIKTLSIPKHESKILKIVCNYGEIFLFPNAYINNPISQMVNSIVALEDFHILIGCKCQLALDIAPILNLAKQINIYKETFTKLYKRYILSKISTTARFSKKHARSIIGIFNTIFKYLDIDQDQIKQLDDTIDTFIPEADAASCQEYIRNIKRIIGMFMEYESKCTCVKEYTKANKLENFDKDFLTKIKKEPDTSGQKVAKTNKITKQKRKQSGSAMHFSSCISFEIYNEINQKINKIKVFRNGSFQVPGVKKPDMSDVVGSIVQIKYYLRETTGNPVEVPYIISVMRNYIFHLQNTEANIMLSKLENIIYFEKSMPLHDIEAGFENKMKFINDYHIPQSTVYRMFRYCNVGLYRISEISLNIEGYSGLLIKCLKPLSNNNDKKITIKILSSGKINLDGFSSELEVIEIYYWLQYIFYKYWDEIVYDRSKFVEETYSDYSRSGFESIYDSDL